MALPSSSSQHEPDLLALLEEFCASCRTTSNGVVYRMATHRRIVKAIAEAYSLAPRALRRDAICRLAADADADRTHSRGWSVVEALLAASSSLPGGPMFPISLRADLLRLLHCSDSHGIDVQQLDRLRFLDGVLRWLFLRQSAVGIRRLTQREPDALLSFLERVEAVYPLSGDRAELTRRLGGCEARRAVERAVRNGNCRSIVGVPTSAG